MLRKTMIALCAVASIGVLAPGMALARGGGGGGGGGGGHGGGGYGGGGGHAGGWGGGGYGARGMSGGSFSNSFAHAAPNGNFSAVQGNRFASSRMGRGFDRDHGRDFRHHRGFFVGDDFYAGDYWDYPDYANDDSYYDNGNCYVVQRRVHTSYGWRVRPVQVCG